MIRQLCYLSTATRDMDDAELGRILAGARTFNEAAGVTGLLAYGEGVFFQVLEGPRDNVAAAFARICRDRRHGGLRLLQDEAVAHRDFDHWVMGFRPLNAEAIAGLNHFNAASAIPAIVAGIGHPLSTAVLREMAKAA